METFQQIIGLVLILAGISIWSFLRMINSATKAAGSLAAKHPQEMLRGGLELWKFFK